MSQLSVLYSACVLLCNVADIKATRIQTVQMLNRNLPVEPVSFARTLTPNSAVATPATGAQKQEPRPNGWLPVGGVPKGKQQTSAPPTAGAGSVSEEERAGKKASMRGGIFGSWTAESSTTTPSAHAAVDQGDHTLPTAASAHGFGEHPVLPAPESESESAWQHVERTLKALLPEAAAQHLRPLICLLAGVVVLTLYISGCFRMLDAGLKMQLSRRNSSKKAQALQSKNLRQQHIVDGQVVFEWSQTADVATIYLTPGKDVTEDDIHVKISKGRIRVGRAGEACAINADLCMAVDKKASRWSLQEKGDLRIHLRKESPGEWPWVLKLCKDESEDSCSTNPFEEVCRISAERINPEACSTNLLDSAEACSTSPSDESCRTPSSCQGQMRPAA